MNTFCTYYNSRTCHTCDLIEMPYQVQLECKEAALKEFLSPLFDGSFEKSVNSETTGFRNKMKLSVTGTSENPIIGLLGFDDKDLGRKILACPLHHPSLIQLTKLLPDFIREAKLVPYSIEQKKGELKGIIGFMSEESHEMYLRFVMRSQEAVTRIKKYLPELQSKIPELKVISVNLQPIAHALLEGEQEIFLTDKQFIDHRLGKISMRLHPKAFVQTNQKVAKHLYETAAAWTKELKIEKFAELYSGQGAFSFFCADSVKQCLGIEINAEAVAEANRSAEKLHLHHLQFKAADAALVEGELKNFSADLILANPPRRGLASATKMLIQLAPKYILYSSCNGETLGLDLKLLVPQYAVKKVQLFDMFPHSKHFETLVLLQRL